MEKDELGDSEIRGQKLGDRSLIVGILGFFTF
jgi:hypothetical protein